MKSHKVLFLAVAIALASQAQANDSLEILGGKSTRILDNEHGVSWSISRIQEYSKFSINFGYLNEGHIKPSQEYSEKIKRDGVFALWYLQRNFTQRFSTGFEVGPYLTGSTIDKEENNKTISSVKYHLDILAGFNADYKVTPNTSFTIKWLHAFPTKEMGSADIFLSGIRYSFGE